MKISSAVSVVDRVLLLFYKLIFCVHMHQSELEVATTLAFSSTLFRNNSAGGKKGVGGAIFLEDVGVVCEISRSGEFSANGAQDVGGAVAVLLGASFKASDTSFGGNFAAEGGAVWGQVRQKCLHNKMHAV